MTANAMKGDHEKCLEAGMGDYLAKPVKPQELSDKAKWWYTMRILIAEDDLTSRRILESVLTKWGYDVVSVAGGAEAWEKIQDTDAPKLAILDWMMPEMDGVEVCRRLRQMAAATPTYVILLTARGDKKDIIKTVKEQIDRMSTITKKLMRVTQYKTKGYLKGKIIDIDKATK